MKLTFDIHVGIHVHVKQLLLVASVGWGYELVQRWKQLKFIGLGSSGDTGWIAIDMYLRRKLASDFLTLTVQYWTRVHELYISRYMEHACKFLSGVGAIQGPSVYGPPPVPEYLVL